MPYAVCFTEQAACRGDLCSLVGAGWDWGGSKRMYGLRPFWVKPVGAERHCWQLLKISKSEEQQL